MAPKKRHPQRTCIVCHQTSDKATLIRVVGTPAGKLIIDPTGKANGRGAYVCRREQCWQTGLQANHLSRALKRPVSAADVTQLISEINQLVETKQ